MLGPRKWVESQNGTLSHLLLSGCGLSPWVLSTLNLCLHIWRVGRKDSIVFRSHRRTSWSTRGDPRAYPGP